MTKQEYTLMECLRWFGIQRLPEKAGSVLPLYAAAIVRVLKTDGREYYVVHSAGADGTLCVKADFEESHGIVRVSCVYPVVPVTVTSEGVDVFSQERSWKEGWLCRCGLCFVPSLPELRSMDERDLNDMCLRVLRLRSYREWRRAGGVAGGFSGRSVRSEFSSADASKSEEAAPAAEAEKPRKVVRKKKQ